MGRCENENKNNVRILQKAPLTRFGRAETNLAVRAFQFCPEKTYSHSRIPVCPRRKPPSAARVSESQIHILEELQSSFPQLQVFLTSLAIKVLTVEWCWAHTLGFVEARRLTGWMHMGEEEKEAHP